MDAVKIRIEAEKEIQDEDFREAVDAMKLRIRNSRKSWFPWRLRLIVLNVNEENN